MDYQKILVVLPARLGDALFCTPAINLIHKHLPATQLDILAMSPVTADMLAFNPAIHAIYQAHELEKISHQYELAIILHYQAITAQELAKIATKVISIEMPDMTKHQSVQAIEFMQGILDCKPPAADDLPYRLYPQAEHYHAIKAKLLAQGADLEHDILIGCHLGCHRIAGLSWWKLLKGASHKKVWPLKNFLKAAVALRKENARIRFVLTGSNSEQHLAKKFLKKAPHAISLIDQTSVLELAALMDYLKVYLTSDTGTLHVACATKVNLTALFGPTSLVRTGPYPTRENHTIIQQANIHQLSVAEVAQAVKIYL